jgi:cardiolipin synthase
MRQLLRLPNLVSLARAGLTPFAVEAILSRRYWLALVIFAAAGITDAIDGVLARKYGLSSRAGAYIDPIADKVLLVSAYLSLGYVELMPLWLVVIVLGRDVLLLGLSGMALLFTRRRSFPPSRWGKLSTFFQILTAGIVIGAEAVGFTVLRHMVQILFVVTAAATIWSGADYLWRGFRMAHSSILVSQD